jgi:hypothetical protein
MDRGKSITAAFLCHLYPRNPASASGSQSHFNESASASVSPTAMQPGKSGTKAP